jgi:hypothetical protein
MTRTKTNNDETRDLWNAHIHTAIAAKAEQQQQ